MKRIFNYALCLAVAGALGLGLTSCSDDDGDSLPSGSVAASATELSTMTSNYVNNVVYPTYKDLQVAAESLHEACVALDNEKKNGTVNQSTIDAACEAFKEARRYWEQSEAFLFGPATDDGIDPHMDSWPLDQTQMADALTNSEVIAGITGSNPAEYVYENNGRFDSTLGFHGLEFILFRNGSNRTADALNADYEDGSGLNSKGEDVESNRKKLQTVSTLSETAFANAVSGDLANMTKLLEYEWDGTETLGTYLKNNASWVYNGAQNLAELLQHGSFFGEEYTSLSVSGIDTWPATIANTIEGCRSICEEVHTQKLAQAYRRATNSGTSEDAADYIESPYSKRSFNDYQDNIYSIKNSLYGVRGTETVSSPATGSIMAFLNNNYPNASELNSALNTAINTLETAKNSGVAFIDAPGAQQVKDCIDAVSALDDALQAAEDWCSANIIVR